MDRVWILLRRSCVWICLAILSSTAHAGGLGSRLSGAAGADLLVQIEIPNLDAFLKKADHFGEIYSTQVSALFPFMLAPSLFQNGQAAQIDLTKSITFVAMSPSKSTVPLAYAVTVRDVPAFLAGLGTPGESSEGVTQYSSEQKTMFAATLGQEVLVVGSRELAVAALNHPPSDESLQVKGDLKLRIPLAAVVALKADSIEQAKTAMIAQMSQQQENAKFGEVFGNLYFDMFVGLGKQIQGLELGLDLDGPDLAFYGSIQPVAGSKLEKFLDAQGMPMEALSAKIAQETLMSMRFGLRTTPEVTEFYLHFIEQLGGILAEQDSQELRAKLEPFVQNFGPIYTAFLLPNPAGQSGFRMVQAFDYQAPDQFGEWMEALMSAWMPQMKEMYSKMGMPVDIRFGKTASGAQEMVLDFSAMTGPQKDAITKMYGGPALRSLFLPEGKKVYLAMGPDAEALLQEWKPILQGLGGADPGKGPVMGIFSIDISAYMKLIFSFMPPEQSAPVLAKMQKFLDAHLVLSDEMTVEAGRWNNVLRYPLEPTLRALKAAQ